MKFTFSLIGTVLIALTLSGINSTPTPDNPPWKSLFNGETLDGWEQLGGEATFHVEGKAIVGTTVPNTPNSFLCTAEHFDDFILEFQVYLSGETNSGVQIRSNSKPEFQDGRVHGYQIEIDPSERAWTGGIYDEARRVVISAGRNGPGQAGV